MNTMNYTSNFRSIYQFMRKNQYQFNCGLMAGTIFCINMSNMKKSPIYNTSDPLCKYRILATSSVKGFIYGITFPISPFVIALSISNKDDFNKHFIPNSVHGCL